MRAKACIPSILLLALIISACGPPKGTFEIEGSPNPLFYGCGATVVNFTVTGPGEGLKINSVIVGYNLFDGSGKKIREGTVSLSPYPGRPPVWYDNHLIIYVPDSTGSAPAADEAIVVFGEGRLDFAATIYAKILSPSLTGPEETYYFTSTKSIPVLPCTRATIEVIDQGPGDEIFIITPEATTVTPTITPVPTRKPREDSGDVPLPPLPSCSIEPNNPNCVP